MYYSMKKLSLFFASLMFLASCNLLETVGTSVIDEIASADLTAVSSEELPSAATSYLNNNYFETYIDQANLAEKLGYQVILSDGEELYFDLDGEILTAEDCSGKKGKKGKKGDDDKFTTLDTALLSQTVKDYLATNYADATIVRAKTDADGNILVGLTNYIIAVFDADGNFIKEFEHHKGKDKGTKIDLASLPVLVTDYISSNYTGAAIKVAFQDNDGGYAVGIVTADGKKKIVIFDAEGTFVAEKTCNG